MSRTCARPSCHQSASATLTYNYRESTVWLSDLSEESHPMTHDICVEHADDLSVPRGWSIRDERTETSAGNAEVESIRPVQHDSEAVQGSLLSA